MKRAAVLGSGLALTGLPGMGYPMMGNGDYKAMVCLFMYGGMDHNDTILPMDAGAHAALKTARPDLFAAYGAAGGSRSREIADLLELQPISEGATGGRRYGMPSQLAPLHQMFNDEELAIIGGVGALVEPTTRASFESRGVRLPPALFSHNDQQNYWQGLRIEGAQAGWGGLFLDAMASRGQVGDERFAAISATGNSLFLSGDQVSPYRITPAGPVRARVTNADALLGTGADRSALRSRLAAYFRRDSSDARSLLQTDYQALRAEGLGASDVFQSSFDSISPISTSFPNSGYGKQLQSVARGIQTGRQLGMSRQIFFVAVGGFDTHSNQAANLPGMQQSMAEAVKAFRDAMVELQAWNDVTLFSGADFGRTLVENGSGTDHGWGSHHFVAGGSVRGKRIVGSLPGYDPDGQEYTASRARLIPTVPIERYSAELGNWFGVEQNAIASVLPNLGNFPAESLGLFKA